MSQNSGRKAKRFTGYHAAAILCAFFAVVIAVNIVMARFAISTFGGTVVDNSYVASQKFNGWLEEARREQEMGWQIAAPMRVDGHLTVVAKDAAGQPLAGAAMELHAIHPLGRAPEQKLQLREISPGLYRSDEALPAGRWKTKVQIRRDGRELDLAFDIQ